MLLSVVNYLVSEVILFGKANFECLNFTNKDSNKSKQNNLSCNKKGCTTCVMNHSYENLGILLFEKCDGSTCVIQNRL